MHLFYGFTHPLQMKMKIKLLVKEALNLLLMPSSVARVRPPKNAWRWALLLWAALMLIGCGDNDPASHTNTGIHDAEQDLHVAQTELWGIGDRWYAYNIEDHSITPKEISWVMIQNQGAFFFRVLRYYGDDGASGKPAMEVRRWDGKAFGDATTLKVETSIRETPACIDFAQMRVVSCEDAQRIDLVWRTDRRPIAEELFAVNNPALYAASGTDTWVVQYASTHPPDTLPQIDETIAREQCDIEDDARQIEDRPAACDTLPWRIASIFDADTQPRITPEVFAAHDVMQLTATMHVAQWRAALDEDAGELTLSARCVNVDTTAACTPSFHDAPTSTTLRIEDLERWTFIDLCGPQGHDAPHTPTLYDTRATLRPGLWPLNDRFDVALERRGEELRVWMAPSQPYATVDHRAFEREDAPPTLWSIPGPATCEF